MLFRTPMDPVTTDRRKQRLLLLTGIPATGKTEMGRFLEREHGFVHMDMEEFLMAPPPKSHADTLRLIERQRTSGKDNVVTWGFMPGQDEPTIRAIQKMGFRMAWFDGDRNAAHRVFRQRGHPPIQLFHAQKDRIKQLDIDSFQPIRLDPFEGREFRSREAIAAELIGLAGDQRV